MILKARCIARNRYIVAAAFFQALLIANDFAKLTAQEFPEFSNSISHSTHNPSTSHSEHHFDQDSSGQDLQRTRVFSSAYPSNVITASATSTPGNYAPEPLAPDRVVTDRDQAEHLTPLSPRGSRQNNSRTKERSTGLGAFLSIGSSLAIVLGLFFAVVWLFRKSSPTGRTSSIPSSVVQVLGRVPLASRQHLLVLRFGSKMVLVSSIQGETRTLSEIHDPLEVDRLAGLCESGKPGSVANSFREILAQGTKA